MKVIVGFPKCATCGHYSEYSYHDKCPNGGVKPLKIDTTNETIYCESCGYSWNIHSSTYHCTKCNSIVNANEIRQEVDQLIELSKMLAKHIQQESVIKQQIITQTDNSIREWVSVVLGTFGHVSGYIIGKLVAIFKGGFLP